MSCSLHSHVLVATVTTLCIFAPGKTNDDQNDSAQQQSELWLAIKKNLTDWGFTEVTDHTSLRSIREVIGVSGRGFLSISAPQCQIEDRIRPRMGDRSGSRKIPAEYEHKCVESGLLGAGEFVHLSGFIAISNWLLRLMATETRSHPPGSQRRPA